jgi:xanthine dehydrogenase accessory factor
MDENIYAELLKALKSNFEAALCTAFIKNPKGNAGFKKQLFITDGEDSKKEDFFVPEDMISRVLQSGVPGYFPLENGGRCLVEPFYPESRLIVLGGGHIALPLVEFAHKTGFSVTVVDDRYAFANRERFPLAREVICGDFEGSIEKLRITGSDFVVIITRGHRHDVDCLRRLAQKPTAYLGMIGSKRRVQIVKEQMLKEGVKEDVLERLKAPIGLDIGAETPEEIAVSILSEVIREKRLKGTRRNRTQPDMQVLEYLAGQHEERAAAVTVTAAKGPVPRGAGAKMAVRQDGSILGSIGGGCSEGAVIHTAMELIARGGYGTVTVDLTAEAAEEEGMVCGGTMEVLIEVIG